ncbi:type II/IV secretion system family protein, partial [Xanthomonas vasicola]
MNANAPVPTTITRHSRLLDMMKSALGGAIGELLDDPDVEEVRANPDGRLWYVKDGRRICHEHTL